MRSTPTRSTGGSQAGGVTSPRMQHSRLQRSSPRGMSEAGDSAGISRWQQADPQVTSIDEASEGHATAMPCHWQQQNGIHSTVKSRSRG